jgi:hypothetical protein
MSNMKPETASSYALWPSESIHLSAVQRVSAMGVARAYCSRHGLDADTFHELVDALGCSDVVVP